MGFVSLQDALRRELRKRVDAGRLTGLALARLTGFTQAHISNFLNRKRGLKLSALDRVLKSTGLSLYDLLDPRELVRFAPLSAGHDKDFADLPVVSPRTAAETEVIVQSDVLEIAKLPPALLARLRPDPAPAPRKSWTRFVLIRPDRDDVAAMWPRLRASCTLLLDRHYNTLRPYRKNERNLYAVAAPHGCIVRFAELFSSAAQTSSTGLLCRPENLHTPVEFLPLAPGRTPADYLVGRVAHISYET